MSRMDGKKTHILLRTDCGSNIVLWMCLYGKTYSKSVDQSGKVVSPARGQLNRKNEYFRVRVRAA